MTNSIDGPGTRLAAVDIRAKAASFSGAIIAGSLPAVFGLDKRASLAIAEATDYMRRP
jgi:hypothetical protein